MADFVCPRENYNGATFGYSRKINKQRGCGHTFLKTPWNFLFTPGNSREIKAPPLLEIVQNWKFLALETSKKFQDQNKNQDPWKFHIFSWSPLEMPHVRYLIPLEIPYPQPPPHVCFFFLNIPLNSHTLNSQIKH